MSLSNIEIIYNPKEVMIRIMLIQFWYRLCNFQMEEWLIPFRFHISKLSYLV